MYCSKCGKECKDNSSFCSGCGNILISGERIEKKSPVNLIKSLAKIRRNYIILGIVSVALLLCLFIIVSGNKMVTEEDVESTIKTLQLEDIEINNEILDFNVTEVKIISQNYDSQTKMCVVNCEVMITSDTMKGTLFYYLKYELEDGNWIIKTYELDEDRGYDFVPLKGVELSQEEVVQYVKELYPEILWKGGNTSAIGMVGAWEDIWAADFPIEYTLVYHETNLDSREDKISYDYTFYTETAYVSGKMVLEYTFMEEGMWKISDFWCEDEEVQWQLEGLWSFDIYTYWIDVYISEIDWENQIAYIQQRGSLMQGGGTYKSITIGFEQKDGCIYFDSFITESGNSGEKVTLIAKIDDLYYLSPSIFTGEEPVESRIGGKNTNETSVPRMETQELQENDLLFNPYLEQYSVYNANSSLQGDEYDNYKNIAIFGVNSTQGELVKGTLSQAIIVLSINEDTGQIKVINVPNNTFLDLASDDKTGKCNVAYSYGGVQQAIRMLNCNMDLAITEFFTIGFEGIIELVDGVGGIWVYVDDEEREAINADTNKNIKEEMAEMLAPIEESGYQRLDGIQAAIYCMGQLNSIRDTYLQSARQQEVFVAILEQIQNMDSEQLITLLTTIAPYIYTSYSMEEIYSLSDLLCKGQVIDAGVFPMEELSEVITLGSKGACVCPIDLEDNVKWLHKFLYNKNNHQPSEEVQMISEELHDFIAAYEDIH